MTLISLALDDADSPEGGCTTHLAGLLLLELSRAPGVEPADYPLLVRLNPGVPWKTRGNAAVVLRLYVGRDPLDVYEAAVALADEYTRGRRPLAGKGYGVALYAGAPPWEDPGLRWLYRKALTDVVTRDVAERVARRSGVRASGGRGVVGAVSSLAALAPWEDYTFELTAYRQPHLWGTPRCVDPRRAVEAEAGAPACLFNNTGPRGDLVAAPRGPDPVLAGFRGDCPEWLPAYSVALCEKPHFWVLYRSNQHTDAHGAPLGAVRPYKAGRLRGVVAGPPAVLPGGHVVVRLRTPQGEVDAAFFRETGPMARAAARLAPGDEVVIQGVVRPYAPRGAATIAVDKLVVTRVAPRFARVAPRCPRCGARMESAGRGRGYRCPRCGYRDPAARPLALPVPAPLAPGVYTPEPGWISHLTMPPGRRPRQTPPPRPWGWRTVVSPVNPPVTHPPVSSGAHRLGGGEPPHPPASTGPEG